MSSSKRRVNAVITNHNTSAIAEVALLSFLRDLRQCTRADARITISDNHSTDASIDRLRATAEMVGAEFMLSRWPHPGPEAAARLDSSGDAQRDFMLSHDDCDHFLLIDSDVEFTTPATLDKLIDYLEREGTIWLTTAREERDPDEAASLLQTTPDMEIEYVVERSHGGRYGRSRKTFMGRSHLHPNQHCSLIPRTDVLMRCLELIGFSPAVMMSGDQTLAGFHDSLGIAARAMAVAGYRYTDAPVTIKHAKGGSWSDALRAARAKQAEERCAELRAALGLPAGEAIHSG